jgi:hypothetical protein
MYYFRSLQCYEIWEPLAEGVILMNLYSAKLFNTLYIWLNYIIYYTDLLSGGRTVASVVQLAKGGCWYDIHNSCVIFFFLWMTVSCQLTMTVHLLSTHYDSTSPVNCYIHNMHFVTNVDHFRLNSYNWSCCWMLNHLTECIFFWEGGVSCHTCRSVCWLNWFCMDMIILKCTVHCGWLAIRAWAYIVQWEDWDLERQKLEYSRYLGEWRVIKQIVGMFLWYKHTWVLFVFIASR